jgi:hypothetical protein
VFAQNLLVLRGCVFLLRISLIVGGGIVTYEIDGKQYVGVMSGRPSGFWVDKNPGAPTVFLFALP